jgi:SAM-dependent methyltransferase
MQEEAWYDDAFGGDYYSRWVRRGATTWDLAGDTSAQVEFTVRTMNLAPGSSVLDLACGHGRHSVALAQRGFAVTGVDLSAELLTVARHAAKVAGVDVHWIEADMREPLPGSFDAAISMDTSFGYFAREEDDEAVLDAVHKALRPGGRLLLDVLARDAHLEQDQPRFWRELAGGELLLLDRHFDAATSRLRIDALMVDPDGSRHDQVFDIRLYTQTELRRMLGRAGFNVRQVWGGYNGAPPGPRRSRLLILSERG